MRRASAAAARLREVHRLAGLADRVVAHRADRVVRAAVALRLRVRGFAAPAARVDRIRSLGRWAAGGTTRAS